MEYFKKHYLELLLLGGVAVSWIGVLSI